MLVITDNAMASMNQLTDGLILNAINTTTNTITAASGFTLDVAKAIWAHYQNITSLETKKCLSST